MIENTTGRDPLLHLLGAMSDGGIEKYVTDMESAGQRQLVNSMDLPTKGSNDPALLALGFTFGEPHEHDPMFRPATLPEGWKREGSDHAMWSYIVDTLGRRRVSVFYKAAYYDRKAFMRVDSVSCYVHHIVWDPQGVLVLDQDWATAEAVGAALDSMIAENTKTITFYESDDRGADRCAELRAQIERAESLRPAAVTS